MIDLPLSLKLQKLKAMYNNPQYHYWKNQIKYRAIIGLIIMAIAGFIFLVAGCSNEKYSSKVICDQGFFSIDVYYATYPDIINRYKKKASFEMWDSSRYYSAIKDLPKNGWLEIHIEGSSLEAGKPSNWTYIYQNMAGEEIMRQSGTDVIPDYSIGSQTGTTKWFATDLCYIPDLCPDIFKFYLINSGTNKKFSYTIYKDKNKAPKQ